MTLFRLGGSVAAIAALTLVAGAQSARATVTDLPVATQLTLTVSPTAIRYPDPVVTISGTLETSASQPAAVANYAIDVSYLGGYIDVPVFTDAAGDFSTQLTIPAPGQITATFSGDPSYAESSATASTWATQLFPARVVLDPIAPRAEWSFTQVTGTVQMRLPDHSWVAAPLAEVQDACPDLVAARADADGRFSLPIQANPGRRCRIRVNGDEIGPAEFGSWQGSATSARAVVPLINLPTWFCRATGPDFNPSPVGDIGLSTGACYGDSAGKLHYDAGAVVRLYFRPATGGSWRLMASAHTKRDGSVDIKLSGYLPHARLAAGKWNFVLPAAHRRREAGQNSPGFGVAITVPTYLKDTKITTPKRHPVLRGQLAYLTHGGPLAAATIVIQRLRSGSWIRSGTARTGANGRFAFDLSKHRHGRYRVLYPGGHLAGAQKAYGSFLGALSTIVSLS